MGLGGGDRFEFGLWRGLRGCFGPWWGDRFGFGLWRGLRGCFGPWWGDRFGFRLWRGLRGHFGLGGVTGLGSGCGGG